MIIVESLVTLLFLAGSLHVTDGQGNDTCYSVPSRIVVKRIPKPTKAPTKAPTLAPVMPPGGCKNANNMCLPGDICCSPNVCRVGLNSTTYCQPPCTNSPGSVCTMSDVCCNGNVCRVNSTSSSTLRCLPPCKNANTMCQVGVDLCCDEYYICRGNGTNPVTGTPGTCQNSFCTCGDKSTSIEGLGKVTGGGWIYLTQKTYLNPDLVCGRGTCCANTYRNMFAGNVLNQVKSNYGFNAMWRKGLPHGSTNFDLDGGCFHFHSDTGKNPYRFLEVVDEVHARWWGMGRVASKMEPRKSDWRDGYCFFVAVQDFGEPGADDTWRLRIWKCELCATTDPMTWTNAFWDSCADNQEVLLFDTNYVPNYPGDTGVYSGLTPSPPLVGGKIRTSDGWNFTNYSRVFPLMSANAANDPQLWRFNGTNVGELTSNGGGNIQIHLPNKRNKYLEYLINANGTCPCLQNLTATDIGDTGFVTGGGWIYLDEQSYLKSGSTNCACPSSAATRYDRIMADESCFTPTLAAIKCTYGFNAKYIGGIPQGNTNFVIHSHDGSSFHFKSVKMTTTNRDYDDLEVVCDEKYGKSGKGVFARWTGIGAVARTVAGAATPIASSSLWRTGYRFYVAVQDNGEPGLMDQFRLRIEDTPECPGTLLFDTDINAGPIYASDILCSNNLALCSDTLNSGYPDFTGISFNGTEAGFIDAGKGGGGNVQIHCKGGPS